MKKNTEPKKIPSTKYTERDVVTEVRIILRTRSGVTTSHQIIGAACTDTITHAGYMGLSQRKQLVRGAIDAVDEILRAHFSDAKKKLEEQSEAVE